MSLRVLARFVMGMPFVAALSPVAAFASQPGWYVALDGGRAHYTGVSGDAMQWLSLPPGPAPGRATSTASTTVTERAANHAAYRFTAGYQFNRYFGLEAGYADLGNSHATGGGDYFWMCNPAPGELCTLAIGVGPYASRAKLSVRGWVLAVTGSWPVSPAWSLFARIGMFDAHTTFNVSSTPSTADSNVVPASMRFSSTDWKSTYGIGVSWAPIDHWAVRLGWDRYARLGNRRMTGRFNVNLLSAGVAYTF